MTQEEFIVELKKINIDINQEQLETLKKFYNLLIEWNKKINLTRITEEKDVYLKHFYDSLTLSKAINLNNITTLCDVGTGAGFPGIVLKILYPHLNITLIDSLQKRVNYLNNIIKELELTNIKAIHIRAEDYKETFDLVTSRAVASIEKLLTFTMHLVSKKGTMVAMKANIDEELNENIKRKISKKYIIKDIIKFNLPIENSNRSLIVIKKNS